MQVVWVVVDDVVVVDVVGEHRVRVSRNERHLAVVVREFFGTSDRPDAHVGACVCGGVSGGEVASLEDP